MYLPACGFACCQQFVDTSVVIFVKWEISLLSEIPHISSTWNYKSKADMDAFLPPLDSR